MNLHMKWNGTYSKRYDQKKCEKILITKIWKVKKHSWHYIRKKKLENIKTKEKGYTIEKGQQTLFTKVKKNMFGNYIW